MSGYEDYGYDVGDSYDYEPDETVTAEDAIQQAAAQAAAAAANKVTAAYAPIVEQLQSQTNAMASVAMYEGMRRQQEDQEKYAEKLKAAVDKAGQRFPGEWTTLSRAIGERARDDPSFLPDSSFQGDVDDATEALITAGRLVREDLRRAEKQANDARADDMLNEMKRAMKPTTLWPR
jgi:hypothetical protein